jgi:hypothetical protein
MPGDTPIDTMRALAFSDDGILGRYAACAWLAVHKPANRDGPIRAIAYLHRQEGGSVDIVPAAHVTSLLRWWIRCVETGAPVVTWLCEHGGADDAIRVCGDGLYVQKGGRTYTLSADGVAKRGGDDLVAEHQRQEAACCDARMARKARRVPRE